MATYVFDGKVSDLRQFQTAFELLPVSSATARLPPNSSITADVVDSVSIPLVYSKEFGNARPKSLGWQKVWNEAALNAMAAYPESRDAVSERLKLLRKVVSGTIKRRFPPASVSRSSDGTISSEEARCPRKWRF